MPYSSYSRRIVRTVPETSLGSATAPEGMKRSGNFLSASFEVASDTPMTPW